MKLWEGRFSKPLDEITNAFNSSIAFDSRMFKEDITGSIVHAMMLGEQGVITAEDKKQIISGLSAILEDIQSGKLQIDPNAEDIHTFIETELTARIGDAGKRLHTARSRNDQVALDLRLWALTKLEELAGRLNALIAVLLDKAGEYAAAVMPGYTHLQRAQPITLGHWFMAYVEMLLRDYDRLGDCAKRMNVNPLGSGALAGTTYPIDREFVAKRLGMNGVTQNSLDGVSDRDFALELLSALSIIMVHLSRFAEEIILFTSGEFGFFEPDDAFSTGSSIMPQKKNPDIAELIRGKSGRVFGDLFTLLTVMKGLGLAYNKDMQEDKEAVFDGVDTVLACLTAAAPMLATIKINTGRMRQAASQGFINATDCADYLVRKGLPFRDAYKIIGRIVARCIEQSANLEDLPIATYREFSELFDEDVYEAINLENCVNRRNMTGAPAPEQVKRQIERVREVRK